MHMKQEAFCTVAFKISQCYITNFSSLSDTFNLVCQQVIVILSTINWKFMLLISLEASFAGWLIK